MFELKGKYATAKVFATTVNNKTISQIVSLLNQPFVKDSTVRIMADTHAGAGCVIGTTMTIKDKVVPNLVGSDIGCAMLAVKLKEKADEIDLQQLDENIRRFVPAGQMIHDEAKIAATHFEVKQLRCWKKPGAGIREMLAYQSMGTLGGGNHFIELNKDFNNHTYLIIHSGSRHLGGEVCQYYQDLAWKRHSDAEKNVMIQKMKEDGRQDEIVTELKRFHKTFELCSNIPKELAYLEGQDLDDYLHDMEIVQEYARDNRAEIARVILESTYLTEESRFETMHNYIDTKNMILRKGAVSAQKDEKLLIPINMRDGSLICVGKGNPDYNYSAPHGAGRLLSRSQAKEQLSMDEFRSAMKGIYTTSISLSTLNESPMAYKPLEEILANIKDTVEVVERIVPIYNFKAGMEEKGKERKK